MLYLVCPRCHLSIRPRHRELDRLPTDCPRCLGRHRERVVLFSSSLAYDQLAASHTQAQQPR